MAIIRVEKPLYVQVHAPEHGDVWSVAWRRKARGGNLGGFAKIGPDHDVKRGEVICDVALHHEIPLYGWAGAPSRIEIKSPCDGLIMRSSYQEDLCEAKAAICVIMFDGGECDENIAALQGLLNDNAKAMISANNHARALAAGKLELPMYATPAYSHSAYRDALAALPRGLECVDDLRVLLPHVPMQMAYALWDKRENFSTVIPPTRIDGRLLRLDWRPSAGGLASVRRYRRGEDAALHDPFANPAASASAYWEQHWSRTNGIAPGTIVQRIRVPWLNVASDPDTTPVNFYLRETIEAFRDGKIGMDLDEFNSKVVAVAASNIIDIELNSDALDAPRLGRPIPSANAFFCRACGGWFERRVCVGCERPFDPALFDTEDGLEDWKFPMPEAVRRTLAGCVESAAFSRPLRRRYNDSVAVRVAEVVLADLLKHRGYLISQVRDDDLRKKVEVMVPPTTLIIAPAPTRQGAVIAPISYAIDDLPEPEPEP